MTVPLLSSLQASFTASLNFAAADHTPRFFHHKQLEVDMTSFNSFIKLNFANVLAATLAFSVSITVSDQSSGAIIS